MPRRLVVSPNVMLKIVTNFWRQGSLRGKDYFDSFRPPSVRCLEFCRADGTPLARARNRPERPMGGPDPRTLRAHRPPPHRRLRRPRARPIGACKLRDLTVDRVAAWSAANERALAPTTAEIALITLGQVCRFAVRRGWLADNPVAKLEPAEKPHWTPKRGRASSKATQLARFLAHAGEPTGRCSSSSPTPASGSAKRSASPGPTSTTTHGADPRPPPTHPPPRTRAPQDRRRKPRSRSSPPPSPSCSANTGSPRRYKAPAPTSSSATRIGRGLDYRDVGERLPRHPQTRRHHRRRAAHPALAPPRLRLAADRQRPQRRLRHPPTRPRQPHHHPQDLRPPLRPRRPRPHRPRTPSTPATARHDARNDR